MLAAALLVVTASCSEDPLPGLLSQAEIAARSGDLRTAAVYYGTAAAEAPGNDFVRWQLAKVLLGIRDGAAAEKEILSAAALGVGDERTRPALAEALFLQGKYQAITELTTEGLGKTPAAIVLAYQCRAQLQLGQAESAERLLQRAAKLSRYAADVAFAEAELALYREDYPLALEALQNVKLMEPDFPYAAARLGEIALAQGDAAAAERHFTEAVEQRFGPWRDLLHRGLARLQQGKVDAAMRDASTLLASSPTHSDVHLFAYQAYAVKGMQKWAQEALEQVLKRDPDHYRASYALARLEADAGNRERAEALVRAAHALQPEFVPARELLAVLLLEQRQAREAIDLVLPVADSDPDDRDLQRILAYGFLQDGRYDELIGIADEIRGLMTDETRAAFDRGIAALGTGASPVALEALEQTIAYGTRDLPAVDPLAIGSGGRQGWPGAHRVAGTDDLMVQAQQHLQAGEEQLAVDRLEQALAEDPTNFAARKALAALSARRDGTPDAAQPSADTIAEAAQDAAQPRLQTADLADTRADRPGSGLEGLLTGELPAESSDTRLALQDLRDQVAADESPPQARRVPISELRGAVPPLDDPGTGQRLSADLAGVDEAQVAAAPRLPVSPADAPEIVPDATQPPVDHSEQQAATVPPASETAATPMLATAQAELAALQKTAEQLQAERHLLQSTLDDLREGRSPPAQAAQLETAETAVAAVAPQAAPAAAERVELERREEPPLQPEGDSTDAPSSPAATDLPASTEAQTVTPAAAVETFVHDWANTWSRQDVDAYLSHYAADFRPSDGSSRTAWEAARRARLTRPQSIQVEISGLEVEVLDGDHALATFAQAYRANHYQDNVTKTLELVREDAAWKIRGEVSR